MDVLSLLKSLTNGYIDDETFKNYNRIGVKKIDENNLFKTEERSPVQMKYVNFNSKRANISVPYIYKGFVMLDKSEANRVGLDKIFKDYKVPSRIYRSYSIIKDFECNVEYLVVHLKEDVIKELSKVVKLEVIGGGIEGFKKVKICIKDMDVKGLGKDNLSKDNLDCMGSKLEKVNVLKAKRKVIKEYLKELEDEREKGEFTKFNDEQIEVLKNHGLNYKLDYVGVGLKESNNVNYYKAKTLELKIKGLVSIPSVNKVKKTIEQGKKLNLYMEEMKQCMDYIEQIKDDKLSTLKKMLYEVENKIRILDSDISEMRFNMFGDEGLWDKIGEGKKMKKNYKYGERELIIELGIEKIVCS